MSELKARQSRNMGMLRFFILWALAWFGARSFCGSKMYSPESINHPLCGCESGVIQKSYLSADNIVVQAILRKGKVAMAKKEYSLAHTKWMCKYHIVFTPKYRRKIIYNQYKVDIRDIIKQLCSYKGVEIIEGHLMPDHIHMLVSIPPKMSVSSFMG